MWNNIKFTPRKLLFSLLLIAGFPLFTSCEPEPPQVIEFTGTDVNAKTADFIMAALPTNARTNNGIGVIDTESLQQELKRNQKVQTRFKEQFAIVAVGVEDCQGGKRDEDDAEQIRLAVSREESSIPYQQLNPTLEGYQDFSGEFRQLGRFENGCQSPNSVENSRVLVVGIKRLSPNVDISSALRNGLESSAVSNLELQDRSMYRVIYNPQEGNWQQITQVGEDRNNRKAIFDIFVLIKEKAWVHNSAKEFGDIYDGENGQPLAELKTFIKDSTLMKDSLKTADAWMTFGLASCDGGLPYNERLAKNRASNLMFDVLKSLDLDRETHPNYVRVILGQYKKECPEAGIGLGEQRPVVIAVANQVRVNDVNLREALYDALQKMQEKKQLLGTVKIEDYSLTQPENQEEDAPVNLEEMIIF